MGYAVAEDFNMGVASQRTNQAGVQQHVPEPSRALPLALQSLPVPHGTPCTELPLAVDGLMHDGLNFSSTRQTPLVSLALEFDKRRPCSKQSSTMSLSFVPSALFSANLKRKQQGEWWGCNTNILRAIRFLWAGDLTCGCLWHEACDEERACNPSRAEGQSIFGEAFLQGPWPEARRPGPLPADEPGWWARLWSLAWWWSRAVMPKIIKYFAVAARSFDPSSGAARSKFPASGSACATAVTELAEAVQTYVHARKALFASERQASWRVVDLEDEQEALFGEAKKKHHCCP